MSKSHPIKSFKSKTPKVYKNKKLNTANFGNFTHTDYQVFLHLVSKIGGVDEVGKYLQPDQLQREHTLKANEFSKAFNVHIKNSYKALQSSVDKLMKTDLKVQRNESDELWRINVCSMAKYNKKAGYITIQFTDSIMPYLAQVKQKFLLYNLKEISNFGSLYTTRLYELIQDFKETGYMIKSVAQLREAFAVGEKFKLYADFKKKTFDHACHEINDNYKMRLSYEEIKEGRKVAAIKFVFKKTRVRKVINQKTGAETNIYEKPTLKTKKSSDVIEGQLAFDEDTKATPLKKALSSLLSTIRSNKE